MAKSKFGWMRFNKPAGTAGSAVTPQASSLFGVFVTGLGSASVLPGVGAGSRK